MSDIEIARKYKNDILKISNKLGISKEAITLYGNDKAKIDNTMIKQNKNGKIILVTAINPTVYGEGKTTVSIGLLDGLCKINKNAIAALREPSLGPVFGFKGGACGGGYSQVIPMEEINLHFTGDMHAITSANNLIVAAIYNHIYQGNELNINEETICFKRCLDVNDRSLRETFNITAASEIMSIFTLANDLEELKTMLGNILTSYTYDNKPIYVHDLNLEGSLVVLLKEAFKPNLVGTLEGNPVLVHGGPFANIAHGCNSLVATKLGMKLSDYVVTEAGFGSDLGAEKFFDIKCRKGNIKPSCIVLVCTIKALKYNAGIKTEDILKENIESVKKGIDNLQAHIDNILNFNSNLIVCLNKYASDTLEEIQIVKDYVEKQNILFAVNDSFANGGIGSQELAKNVVSLCEKENNFHYLYDDNCKVKDKIKKVCMNVYHAKEVVFSDKSEDKLKEIEKLKINNYPVCISKTQYSLTDDAKVLGYPKGHTMHVRDIEIYSGAGFITVLMGNTIKMPGLPKKPNYEKIDLDKDGNIVGLS